MWMGNSIRWHYSTIIGECKGYQFQKWCACIEENNRIDII